MTLVINIFLHTTAFQSLFFPFIGTISVNPKDDCDAGKIQLDQQFSKCTCKPVLTRKIMFSSSKVSKDPVPDAYRIRD